MQRIMPVSRGFVVPVFLLTLCVMLCSGSKCNSETKEHGTVTESQHSGNFNFPDQDKLGVSLYNENIVVSSVRSESYETDGELTRTSISYETSDGYESVVAWFEGKLGETGTKVADDVGGESTTWHLVKGDGDSTLINVYPAMAGGTMVEVSRSNMIQ